MPNSHFKKIRSAISSKRKVETAQSALDSFRNITEITLSFASFGTEIDLWPLNHLLMKKGLLALPRVEGDHLAIYAVTDLGQLERSKWGILEPLPDKCPRLETKDISLVLVPGLAFDKAHHRKGYGFGYYDRLLKQMPQAKKIGVGFREQLADELLETHEGDVPLDSLSLF